MKALKDSAIYFGFQKSESIHEFFCENFNDRNLVNCVIIAFKNLAPQASKQFVAKHLMVPPKSMTVVLELMGAIMTAFIKIHTVSNLNFLKLQLAITYGI